MLRIHDQLDQVHSLNSSLKKIYYCDQDVTEDGTHRAPQPAQFNQVYKFSINCAAFGQIAQAVARNVSHLLLHLSHSNDS